VHKAYCDGACRVSNPGICSCAFVIYKDEVEVHTEGKYIGPELRSNNFAEYQGLILLLEYLYLHNIRNVIIYSDSELVVNQTLGKCEVKQPDLKVLAAKCYGLLVRGCHVLKHIKGHDGNKGNERADELCNAMLDAHKEEYEKTLA
jgi:probable phosphoglycerate mutase